MANLVKFYPCLRAFSALSARTMSTAGSGAGKGGGDGGSIRTAGGKFGEMEAAREGEYFRKLQAAQLKELRESMEKSRDFHQEQIEDYEDPKSGLEKAIAMHKQKLKELEALSKKDGQDSDWSAAISPL